MKIIRAVPFITTVLIMAVIFGFSSQSSETSSEISVDFTEHIVDSLPIIRDMSDAEKKEFVTGIHRFVRKAAHFTLYAMLGFSAAAMFFSIKPKRRALYIWLLAVIMSFIYASTDEFHQMFVGGRGPRVSDVFLDTAGSMFGGGMFFLIKKLFYKIRSFFLAS